MEQVFLWVAHSSCHPTSSITHQNIVHVSTMQITLLHTPKQRHFIERKGLL